MTDFKNEGNSFTNVAIDNFPNGIKVRLQQYYTNDNEFVFESYVDCCEENLWFFDHGADKAHADSYHSALCQIFSSDLGDKIADNFGTYLQLMKKVADLMTRFDG